MLRSAEESGVPLSRGCSVVSKAARLLPLVALQLACQGETGAPGEPGAGGQGEPGPKGPDGAPPDGAASLSAVAPGTFYIGHDVDLVISGYATSWKESAPPAIVFSDANLSAGPVTVASPTSLLTRVHVSDLTAVADKTLTLTVGDLVYKGLSVEPPLGVVPLWGTSDDVVPGIRQGSVSLLEAFQRDLDTPFLDPRIFLRAGDTDLSDARIQQEGLSPFTRTFLQLTDVVAVEGTYDLVAADIPGSTQLSTAPAALEVVARDEHVLAHPAPGAPSTTTAVLGELHASSLFSVTNGPDEEWLHVRVSSDDVLAVPAFVVLPASGKFSERVKQTDAFFDYSLFQDIHVLTAPSEPTYLVALDYYTEGASDVEVELGSDPVLDHDPYSGANLVFESIDEPGKTDLYHLSALKDQELQIWMVGGGDLGGIFGGASTCAQFAATVIVRSEVDGAIVYADQEAICPGAAFDLAQSCGSYACGLDPVTIPIPEDGNYLVYIEASQVLGGSPTFDYVTFIGVVPP